MFFLENLTGVKCRERLRSSSMLLLSVALSVLATLTRLKAGRGAPVVPVLHEDKSYTKIMDLV
jgi:hypothetical protein